MVIITEGSHPDGMYFIHVGKLVVICGMMDSEGQPPIVVKVLKAPASFGDSGLVFGGTRNASIVSVTYAKL